ncbi:hypothetical protein ABIC60_003852 [Phyllobacterium ifriqiyense]
MTDAQSQTGRFHVHHHRFRNWARTVSDLPTADAASFRVKLYENNILVGSYSAEPQFTPTSNDNRSSNSSGLSFLWVQSK